MANRRAYEDTRIRALHNSAVDASIGAAIVRHRCRVALGERCIGANSPDGLRYPTPAEIKSARAECLRLARKRSK